ncbi:MAG: tRNA (adenosine(37)-N6)-dimethylallyltransferase MiaA [Pseudomonadota bacterium]
MTERIDSGPYGATHRRVVNLMGPTAAGKTAVAMALAERLPVQLISVDSAQVYRGMDIGTGKPDQATLLRYPHALIDIAEPFEPYSAAMFARDAAGAIEAAWRVGRLPVLVGGTGLYYRALFDGLAPMPPADANLRASIEEAARHSGWAAQHGRLAELDPVTAARLHPNDAQRIQRALEVTLTVGRPMSGLLDADGPRFEAETLNIAVTTYDRATLHDRIAMRFRQMLADGLLEEVRRLAAHPSMHEGLPSMRSVGYRQAFQCLTGELQRADLPDRGIAATRQLARRQLTWLRKDGSIDWFDSERADHVDAIHDRVVRFHVG